jgi:hypothetical protein
MASKKPVREKWIHFRLSQEELDKAEKLRETKGDDNLSQLFRRALREMAERTFPQATSI